MDLSDYKTWVIWSVSQCGTDAAIWGDVMVSSSDEAWDAFKTYEQESICEDHVFFVTDISKMRTHQEVFEDISSSLSEKGFVLTESCIEGFVRMMRSIQDRRVLN